MGISEIRRRISEIEEHLKVIRQDLADLDETTVELPETYGRGYAPQSRPVITLSNGKTIDTLNARENFTAVFRYAVQQKGIAAVKRCFANRTRLIFDERPGNDPRYRSIGADHWIDSHGGTDAVKIPTIKKLSRDLRLGLTVKKVLCQ